MKKQFTITLFCFLASVVWVSAFDMNSSSKYRDEEDFVFFAVAGQQYEVYVEDLNEDWDSSLLVWLGDELSYIDEYIGMELFTLIPRSDTVVKITVQNAGFMKGVGYSYSISVNRNVSCSIRDVSGWVVNENDAPLEGALIKTNLGGSDITDSRGYFTIKACLGARTLDVEYGDFLKRVSVHERNIVIEGAQAAEEKESACFISTFF